MRKRRPAPPLPSPAGGGGVLDAQGEEAAGALVAVPGGAYASAVIGPEPVEIHLEPARDDSARGGLARIASLLAESGPRRERGAGRARAGTAAPRRGEGRGGTPAAAAKRALRGSSRGRDPRERIPALRST